MYVLKNDQLLKFYFTDKDKSFLNNPKHEFLLAIFNKMINNHSEFSSTSRQYLNRTFDTDPKKLRQNDETQLL